jgi:hypothetical protein
MTRKDLATALGRHPGTIRNVLTGATVQIPTQQALTDFFGVELFPGISPTPTTVRVMLPAGTRLILPGAQYAGAIAGHFGATGASAGGEIVLPRVVICHLAEPAQCRALPSANPNQTA